MSTRYSCRKCDYSFTVGRGQLTTADLKTHCGELMSATSISQPAPQPTPQQPMSLFAKDQLVWVRLGPVGKERKYPGVVLAWDDKQQFAVEVEDEVEAFGGRKYKCKSKHTVDHKKLSTRV